MKPRAADSTRKSPSAPKRQRDAAAPSKAPAAPRSGEPNGRDAVHPSPPVKPVQ